MKKVELVLVVMASLLWVLRLLNVNFSYSDECIAYIFLTLSLLYLGGGWYLFKKPKQNVFISIVCSLLFSIASLAILFKVLAAVGMDKLMVYVSIATLGVLLLTWSLSILAEVDLKPYYKAMLKRLLLLAVVTGTLSFVPSINLFEFYHREYPGFFLTMRFDMEPNNKDYLRELKEYERGQKNLKVALLDNSLKEITDWRPYAKYNIDSATGLPIGLELPYQLNDLKFTLNEVNENTEYMLEGIDTAWTPAASQQSSFFYVDLPPGRYTLKIRDKENPTSTVQIFTFMIMPPFWKSFWFYGIAILISLISLLLITIIIIRKRLKARQRKEELSRTMAEMELKALRSQMNPHFLFNSLSSIQNLINKGDIESANQYLSKYASLMRMILDNSERTVIPIEDEIKTINLYLELESLRFNFNYAITIDKEVDIYNNEIPAMLIQPYIENAINHGLSHKKGKGIITVSINKQNKHIVCSVEDNGIGRKRAEDIKSKNSVNIKSYGMQLTSERLKILNMRHESNLSVKVLDLMDENNNSAGTKVEIYIPLNN